MQTLLDGLERFKFFLQLVGTFVLLIYLSVEEIDLCLSNANLHFDSTDLGLALKPLFEKLGKHFSKKCFIRRWCGTAPGCFIKQLERPF